MNEDSDMVELLQKISELEEELKVCGETHVEMVYEASLLREEVESLKSQLKAEQAKAHQMEMKYLMAL